MTFAVLFAAISAAAVADDRMPPLSPVQTVADVPFLQEQRDPFVISKNALENDFRGLAMDSAGRAWAVGPSGVYDVKAGIWHSLDGPAFDVAHDPQTKTIWMAGWDGVYRWSANDAKPQRAGLEGTPLGIVRVAGKRLFVGGPDGIWERIDNAWQKIDGHFATSLADVEVADGALWIATQRGLFRLGAGTTRRIFAPDEIASGAVSALAVAPDGRLWVGGSGGLDVYEKSRRVAHIGGAEGLPCSIVRSLKFDPQGTLWVGTVRGLGRYDGKRWTWRNSLRWLPSDDVRDVAVSSDSRTAWIATASGLARLHREETTLAAKAAHFDRLVRARHVRSPGLVERCILKERGNLESFAPTDTDNDGLFTGLYVGAESYRFAVTRDPQAAANAREAFRALEFLQNVTGSPGFIARTVIPVEWNAMADRNQKYTPQQIAAERVDNPRFKRVEERWRTSSDGKWLWKGDTSSDEISGHYFAFGVYYDLVADAEERQRVAAHVRSVTDYIIEGNYALRDLDGQPTLWGVWAPDRLNGDPNWQPERGSNSVEILSFLAVAHHVTGDEKYLAELRRLFEQEHYKEMILQAKIWAPSEFTYIDDQLLALSFRGLLAYDTDPARRDVYLESLSRWFEVIRHDASPLYAFVYGSIFGGEIQAPACVDFLRDAPLDMIDWTVDTSWREDVRLVRRPVIADIQTDRLLSPSERGLNKWDGNPYRADHGSGGGDESSSVHWLLPYWMGRYHGIVIAPEPSAR